MHGERGGGTDGIPFVLALMNCREMFTTARFDDMMEAVSDVPCSSPAAGRHSSGETLPSLLQSN